jgi:hypothetical protein
MASFFCLMMIHLPKITRIYRNLKGNICEMFKLITLIKAVDIFELDSLDVDVKLLFILISFSI